jgi:hypothetical protein
MTHDHHHAAMPTVPGAMDAGLGDLLFWGSLAFALAIACVVVAFAFGATVLLAHAFGSGPPAGAATPVTG